MVRYVESVLDDMDISMQRPDFFLMFCFQITCTGGCFLMNFHEVWMFVLLRIAISGLCYSQIFLFGSLAIHMCTS